MDRIQSDRIQSNDYCGSGGMDKNDLILAAIEQLYAKVVEVKVDVGGLKTEIDGLKSDMVEVKADIRELKADMVEVKTDIGGLKVRMDDLEAGQRAMKQVIGGNHLKVMGRIDQLSEQLERHIRHPV